MAKRLFGKPFMNGYRQLLRHSKYRWVVLLGTLVYLVSPLDIFPDVVPILGWVDDGLVATIAITEITQMLLDRKRSLRQVADTLDTTEAVDANASVIDVNAMTLV